MWARLCTMAAEFTMILIGVLIVGVGALIAFAPDRVESVARELGSRIFGGEERARTHARRLTRGTSVVFFVCGAIVLAVMGFVALS